MFKITSEMDHTNASHARKPLLIALIAQAMESAPAVRILCFCSQMEAAVTALVP